MPVVCLEGATELLPERNEAPKSPAAGRSPVEWLDLERSWRGPITNRSFNLHTTASFFSAVQTSYLAQDGEGRYARSVQRGATSVYIRTRLPATRVKAILDHQRTQSDSATHPLLKHNYPIRHTAVQRHLLQHHCPYSSHLTSRTQGHLRQRHRCPSSYHKSP